VGADVAFEVVEEFGEGGVGGLGREVEGWFEVDEEAAGGQVGGEEGDDG
jgi:hypothetical protein